MVSALAPSFIFNLEFCLTVSLHPGARILHQYSSEAKAFADLLYMSLTTLRGSRTLGEEYCDIVHVESESQRLPSLEVSLMADIRE